MALLLALLTIPTILIEDTMNITSAVLALAVPNVSNQPEITHQNKETSSLVLRQLQLETRNLFPLQFNLPLPLLTFFA